MRMLPDNPSLEFLRREAKDLLGALREADPAATLDEAQRSLARLYGVRDWPSLRAEVERRRALAPEPEPGLAEGLADAFGLGRPTAPIAPIAYQHMGRSWLLETDRGRWVAAPVFDWIGDEQAAVGVGLLERAQAAGVRSPRPVHDSNGRLVHRVADRNWRIDEWMELGPTPIRPVRSAVARRVGEILATIHGAGGATDADITPYLTYRRPLEDWETLVARARGAGRAWADDLAALLPSVAALHGVVAERPARRILSICDLVPEGVRYGPADDLVVVHWDFAGAHVPEWELAYVLVQWAAYGGVNHGAARAVLDGYRGAAGDVPALDLGSFTVGVSGYLNWTFNAFCEAIDPEDAEQGAFAERAAAELLAEPLTVETLERLLVGIAPARH